MKKDYYIFKSGELKRDNFNILLIYVVDDITHKNILPLETIDNIFVFGKLNINTDLLCYLGEKNINLHTFNYYGVYRSSVTGIGMQHSGNTHVKQASHYLDINKRLYLAKEFIRGAIWSMNKNLMEYNVGLDYNVFMTKLESALTIADVMGVEGEFRRKYYDKFDDYILKNLIFAKRTKRPPENEINALISFGNMICYSQCLNAIKQTYLNSTISYLHECGDRRHSLCLDISEIFKPIIIDRVIFKLVNTKKITYKHFNKDVSFCYLNESGKKIFIDELEKKLDETFFYRKLNRDISYRNLIKLECYKLCKHILDIENYKVLKIDW